MLCPYCIEQVSEDLEEEYRLIQKIKSKHIACVKTDLPVPQRFDRVLVRTGQWECPYCNFTKAIYAKQPQRPAELIKNTSCFCCNDSGSIHHYLVRKFLIEDYIGTDPRVRCRRCKAGAGVDGWDIATKEDCDRIHQSELSKIK